MLKCKVVAYTRNKCSVVRIGGTNMKDQLIKAMQKCQLVTIIYLSKSEVITKRKVKILEIAGDKFTAYCFIKQARRTFIIQNVLAIHPIFLKD